MEKVESSLKADTWPNVAPGEAYRRAAVLLLIYTRNREDYIVFMRRTETVEHHKGQISLPGGAQDPGDVDLVHTALRETQEELGVAPEAVDVLGTLRDVYARVSGFLITPVLGQVKPQYSQESLVFKPNMGEVAEVIEVPVRALRDERAHHTRLYTAPDGLQYDIHYYTYGPYEIWGATGRILYEYFRTESSR